VKHCHQSGSKRPNPEQDGAGNDPSQRELAPERIVPAFWRRVAAQAMLVDITYKVRSYGADNPPLDF